MISHKLKYGIYHWDTFDNETILIDESNDLTDAVKKVKDKYGARINMGSGADRVDIVDDTGKVIRIFYVS